VILILGIAEVQQFSGWKAFGSVILVICIWILITLILMFFIAYFTKPAAIAFLQLY